jgi:hypothetical protein
MYPNQIQNMNVLAVPVPVYNPNINRQNFNPLINPGKVQTKPYVSYQPSGIPNQFHSKPPLHDLFDNRAKELQHDQDNDDLADEIADQIYDIIQEKYPK